MVETFEKSRESEVSKSSKSEIKSYTPKNLDYSKQKKEDENEAAALLRQIENFWWKNSKWEKKEVKRELDYGQFEKLSNDDKFAYLYDKLPSSWFPVKRVSSGNIKSMYGSVEPALWWIKGIKVTIRGVDNNWYNSYHLLKQNWMYVLRSCKANVLTTVFDWDDEVVTWNKLWNCLNNRFKAYLNSKK